MGTVTRTVRYDGATRREWIAQRKLEVRTRRETVEGVMGCLIATAPSERRKVKTITLRITEDELEIMNTTQPELTLGDARLLTVKETALLLQRSQKQVRRYLKSGHLSGRKSPGNGNWLIDERAVQEFLRT